MTSLEILGLATPAFLCAVCGAFVWWQLRH